MKLENVIESIELSIHYYYQTNGANPDTIFVSTALARFIKSEIRLLKYRHPDVGGLLTICGIDLCEYESDEMKYFLAIKGTITDYGLD